MRKVLAIAAATLVLASCGSKPGRDPNEKPMVAKIPPKTQAEIDPEAYKRNASSAFSEVPPEMRTQFRKLFLCTISQNNKSGVPKPVDGAFVRTLIAQLKVNPTIADTCVG